MSISETIFVERVLVVFDAKGALRGAHQERVRRIADGDRVVQDITMPAEPLSAQSLAGALPSSAELLADLATARRDTERLTAERDDLMAKLAAREAVASPAPQDGTVTPLQARKALRMAGLREAVNAAMASAPDDVRDAWEYGLTVERASPLIAAMAATLALSEEQLDQLFALAATL